MHAEMRLLPQVIVDARTLPAPAVVSPTEHLMITSKLLCNPCNLVIESVNATCGINITTVGTHGKSYPGWKMPALDIPEGKEIERGVQVRLSTQHVAVMEVKREMAAKTLHDEGGFTIPRPTKDQKAEHSQTVLLSVGADRLDQDAPALFSAKGLRDFSKEVSAMQAPRPVQIRGATVAKRQTMASEPATLPAQRPQVLGEGSLLAAQRADVQAQYLHLRVGLEALPAPALSPTFQDNTHLHPKPEKGPAPHSPRGGPE